MRAVNWRKLRWAVLALALGVLVGLIQCHAPALVTSPNGDFLQYWAAARLVLAGENPFVWERVYALWRAAGWTRDWALVMYNPPWLLGLVLPLGALSAQVAWLVWLAGLTGLVFAVAEVSWRWYGGEARQRWVAWGVTLTFMPTLLAVTSGQTGPLVLAGLLVWVAGMRHRRDGLAGLGLALMACKPHVLYLVWPVALFGVVTARRWRVVAWTGLWLALGVGVPSVFYPLLLRDYLLAVRTQPPALWISPTWGTFLRLLWGPERFALQFVPSLIGGALYTVYAWRRRAAWDWLRELPGLVSVSLITRPYGWTHDLVTLVPALVAVAAPWLRAERGVRRRVALGFVAATALMWAGQLWLPQGDHWLVWLPLLWGGVVHGARRLVVQSSGHLVVSSSGR